MTTEGETPKTLSTLQKAYLKLEEMQAKVAALEGEKAEPEPQLPTLPMEGLRR